jgi:hypothetical protein
MRTSIIPLALVTAFTVTACSSQEHPPSSPTSPSSALVSSASSTGLQGKPGGGSDISVTTTVNDVDGSGLASDIASDGQGAYMNGVSGVISILTANGYNGIANGDWQFDTTASPVRRVTYSFDMDDAIQPGDPHYTGPANPPYWGAQPQLARIEVKCTLLGKDMLTMSAGGSFTCPMAGHLFVNGVEYGFAPSLSFTRYPETTDAQVVCNAANSGGCNDWFIEPIGSVPAVARLVQHTQKTETNEGDFYVRFRIHVTRP